MFAKREKTVYLKQCRAKTVERLVVNHMSVIQRLFKADYTYGQALVNICAPMCLLADV